MRFVVYKRSETRDIKTMKEMNNETIKIALNQLLDEAFDNKRELSCDHEFAMEDWNAKKIGFKEFQLKCTKITWSIHRIEKEIEVLEYMIEKRDLSPFGDSSLLEHMVEKRK